MSVTYLSRSGWGVTPDSNFDAVNFNASRVIDGNSSTQWYSANTGYPHSLIFDMLAPQNFNWLRIDPCNDTNHMDHGIEIYTSTDGSTWGTAVYSATWSDRTVKTFSIPIQFGKRYIKFQGTSGSDNFFMCTEFDVGYEPINSQLFPQ